MQLAHLHDHGSAREWCFTGPTLLAFARALLAAGASEGQAEPIPVPTVIDRSHANQAYVTYEFRDEAMCTEFINATSSHRKPLYTHPSDEIAALRERITELETSEKFWISVSEGYGKLMNKHIVTLSERIAKYQAVCAAAYQFVGAVDGPVRFLDALSNAANGEPASVDASLALLPAEPSERIAGMEKDAERYRWLRDNGDLSVRDVFGSWCEQLNDGLDAAIDAAIAKEKRDD
jgi:hypothetical protein